MKTINLVLNLLLCIAPVWLQGQTSQGGDVASSNMVNCSANTFYAVSASNDVYSLTINGTTIVNNGIVASSTYNLNSLAVGNDLMNGTSQHFFYSSNGDSLKYYDGTNWNFLLYDPVTYHNAGASGPYIYYMAYSLPPTISRFTGSALNIIMVDSNLVFTVADIGVTTFGTIYYFAGSGATTQFMYEISSTGNLLNTYPMNLNTAGGYGCFVMNNTIYIGIGPAGSPANSLIPITISGSNAVAGTPMAMPALNFKDLGSCTGEVTNVSTLSGSRKELKLFPNPASEYLKIETEIAESDEGYLKIYDINSRIVIEKNIVFNDKNSFVQNISELENGFYFLTLQTKNSSYSDKFIVE
ncbi:MAG: T9SS type A sorting domain-containing protein [Bacteroidota bacterium]